MLEQVKLIGHLDELDFRWLKNNDIKEEKAI